jgi:hypothetical protein
MESNLLQLIKTTQTFGHTQAGEFIKHQLIPVFGPRLVQMGFEKNIYFFKGTTIGACFGIGRYRNMVDPQVPDQLIQAQEMLRYLQQFDSRMLIVRNSVRVDLMDYTLYFDLQKETVDGLLLTIKSK